MSEPHSESHPLDGLTEDEADQRIAQLEEMADRADEHAKAVRAQVKELKAARKTLEPPVPLDQRNAAVTEANAQPAEITVEGGQV